MKSEHPNNGVNDDSPDILQLYRDHWKVLYISAFRILKDKQASEDVVQDVFINVWNKRDELEIKNSLKAYLATAVKYEVYRRIRHEQKFQPIAEEMTELFFEYSVTEKLEYKESVREITDLVQDLPEKCRVVYMLSRNEHLSHKEISNRLSISTKTVRNHLTRALRELRLGLSHLTLLIITFFFR